MPPIPSAKSRWRLSALGILFGALFFAASLTPSLMPRPTLWQGLLGGGAMAFGYGLAAALLWGRRFLELPVVPPAAARQTRAMCIVGGLVVAGLALWKAADRQNQIRALAGIEPVEAVHPVVVCTTALVTFALVLLIARAFRWIFGRISDYLDRYVTPRISRTIGFVLAPRSVLVSGGRHPSATRRWRDGGGLCRR